jgi:hypothetical protein
MPFGSVNFEAGVDDNGERYTWLPRAVVDRLRYLRTRSENFSDVILRLAAEGWLGGRDAPCGRRHLDAHFRMSAMDVGRTAVPLRDLRHCVHRRQERQQHQHRDAKSGDRQFG